MAEQGYDQIQDIVETVFYFVRHAHTDWTPDEGRPLSPAGQIAAQRLAHLLSAYPIDRIYASPYRRARQTVEPLADRLGLPIDIEADLRERELGELPAGEDFQAAVKGTWQEPAYAHPGGESNLAAQRRGVAVVRRLLEQALGEHVVLSTHGNLLALVSQHYVSSIDYDFWIALTMPDVYQLKINGDETSIARLLWSK